MTRRREAAPILLVVALLGCRGAPAPAPPAHAAAPSEEGDQATAPGSTVARLRREARALAPLFTAEAVRRFLAATELLGPIAPRGVVWQDRARRLLLDEAAYARLPATGREGLRRIVLDEEFYYTTKYGSPLAWARPLTLVAGNDPHALSGKRILDFGYGLATPGRLLASLGNDVVGVDVDPILPRLYREPSDQGEIAGRDGVRGRLRLVDGQWPADARARAEVGSGFDLVLSKNTLKRGYVHPERAVDPARTIQLGVDDAAFLRALHDALVPGGRALVYNICPAPAPPDRPYIPWADGRSPFSREAWERAGFRVLAFDVDDTAATRAMARALGWDREDPPMDVDHDLFARYTLVEKPAAPRGSPGTAPARGGP